MIVFLLLTLYLEIENEEVRKRGTFPWLQSGKGETARQVTGK